MIYLDHNATTPARPQVIEGLVPFFAERAGNPSSVHSAGRAARQGLDEARRRVAAVLDVHERQVIFTSGGTEANNTVIFGCAAQHGFRGHLIVSAIEHPSILLVCERLQRYDMEITQVAVDRHGCLSAEEVLSAIRKDTRLVSVMHANNESGVIQPVAEIARECRLLAVPMHSDAVQSMGKIPLSFEELGVDFLSLSAHKFGGPKGVGALIVEKSAQYNALLMGGGQESGRRSGTENLPGIVGFGIAAQLAQVTLAAEYQRLRSLQHYLEETIKIAIPECVIFGQGAANRLPNTTALGVHGMDGETVVMNLDLEGFSLSSGSACGSGRHKPSHVLIAMGCAADLALSMVRVSLGWNTTQEEVERFVVGFTRVIKRLQHLSHM